MRPKRLAHDPRPRRRRSPSRPAPAPSPWQARSWREAMERDPFLPWPWSYLAILEELVHLARIAVTALLAVAGRMARAGRPSRPRDDSRSA